MIRPTYLAYNGLAAASSGQNTPPRPFPTFYAAYLVLLQSFAGHLGTGSIRYPDVSPPALTLPTTLRRLNHRRDRLRGILCPLAALSRSRKCTTASCLPRQLAVESG